MASDEIMMLRGRLATAKSLIDGIAIGIDTDLRHARALLDPYEDKGKIKTGELKTVVDRIHDQVQRYRELKERIAALKEDLGE